MSPERQAKLARLAIAIAKCHRGESGNPEPHELPLGPAEKIVAHFEDMWTATDSEIDRRCQNVRAGIVR